MINKCLVYRYEPHDGQGVKLADCLMRIGLRVVGRQGLTGKRRSYFDHEDHGSHKEATIQYVAVYPGARSLVVGVVR